MEGIFSAALICTPEKWQKNLCEECKKGSREKFKHSLLSYIDTHGQSLCEVGYECRIAT